MAGQIGLHPPTMMLPQNISDQIVLTFTNMSQVVKAVKSHLNYTILGTIYVLDLATKAEIKQHMITFLSSNVRDYLCYYLMTEVDATILFYSM